MDEVIQQNAAIGKVVHSSQLTVESAQGFVEDGLDCAINLKIQARPLDQK
ncbi:MAG: hypothetical protein ACXWTW_03060 [Methylobacter sp.]